MIHWASETGLCRNTECSVSMLQAKQTSRFQLLCHRELSNKVPVVAKVYHELAVVLV